MKHLLSILILLGFMSVANSQQSFKPLSQYILDHDIQSDNGAMIYTLQRCSALLNSINAIFKTNCYSAHQWQMNLINPWVSNKLIKI